MRGLFPEFAERSEQDYRAAWQSAQFIFDASVLLNLYRYRPATRNQLLTVLRQLADRIWIPYQAAMEFQRNRLKVIAEQNSRFSEVKKVVEQARSGLISNIEKLQLENRHSSIDPQPLMTGMGDLIQEFMRKLEDLRKTQQKITEPDPLKDQIEDLFAGKVGDRPEGQRNLDELYRRAEERFKLQIPPGYKDQEKGKDDNDAHLHGGLIYKRRYGDYLVWTQILEHAKSEDLKSVIFVTDDTKEDWWARIDSEGAKTLGPRPELIDEARTASGITSFLMYGPEGFLKYAKEFLKAKVSEATIKEVRDVSATRRPTTLPSVRPHLAESLVFDWVCKRFDIAEMHGGLPDIIARCKEETFAFEVIVLSNPENINRRIRERMLMAQHVMEQLGLAAFTFVIIVRTTSEIPMLKDRILTGYFQGIDGRFRVALGAIIDTERGTAFHPFEDFQLASP